MKDLEQYVKPQQWYVNAESRLSDGEHTIEYVGRYSNRPAMSECRIVNFDGNTVIFWYDEKEKLSFYNDGTMRTKRYLGPQGYIAKFANRIYNYNLNRFFKVDPLGQISII